MSKIAKWGAAALVTITGQAFANNFDDEVKTLALSASQMAHNAVRARQAQGVSTDNAERFAALVKLDHTFMYGNHASLAASEGVKINAALGDHSALNDSVQSCRNALEENLSTAARLDFVIACQGKLQDLSNHKILTVDTARLERQRKEAAQIKQQLNG